jgi:alpha-L-fucosidase
MKTTRREFLGRVSLSLAGTALAGASGVRAAEEGPQLARPTPAQIAWQDCEIGLVYHFDLPVAAGEFAANNQVRRRLDPADYNPTELDTDQWLEAAKAAGAGYAVFTATHFNGFMQWQSDLYPYGVKQARWRDGKGDVVADFVESCRKANIKPGIYFSSHRNVYWEVWGHYVDWGRGKGTEAQARFNRVAEKMTEELTSRYGPLVQIWFDAGVKTPPEGGPDVLPIFEKHQPESVFYHNRDRSDHRWIGNEQGHAGEPCWATMPAAPGEISHNAPGWKQHLYHGVAGGGCWSPGMVDIPLRSVGAHSWFWAPDQDAAAYSSDQLLKIYDRSVGRNCNLVVGEVVQPDGTVPESDVHRLAEFGQAVRERFANPAGQTSGAGQQLEVELPQPKTIDQIVLAEEIAHGERVRAYRVEGLVAGDAWKTLAAGQSIGHKWIHRIEPVEVAGLRLRITESAASPMIRRMAAYGPRS